MRIAEMCRMQPNGAIEQTGIWIDQQLVRIKAMAIRRIVRAIHAIAVTLSRAHVGYAAMPEIAFPLQRHACDFLRA